MAHTKAMILKPCPYCHKDIPRGMTVCPYCHRNEAGQPVQMDTAAPSPEPTNGKFFDQDLAELASEDPFVKEQATIRMAQKGFGVVQALISILGDQAKPGLAGVAKVLGRIGDRRAIGVLTQAAKLGDEELRTAAVWALAQFHEPEILPALLSESERPHPVIQGFIAHVLGTYQDARIIPALDKLAHHPNREVAFHAAYAMGEMGDPRAISALCRAYRRRDPMVRAAASASLRRLGASPPGSSFRWWILCGGVMAAMVAVFLFHVYR